MNRMVYAVAVAALMSAGTAQAQQQDNKLRWASTVSITAPDPYYNFHREAMILNGQLVWDTLIYRNPENGEYEPLLATSWEWTDDVTLVFTLREGVKFHDGSDFNAADVVYTYNYISNPDNKINVQSNVNWIAGAEALDDYKVQLKLKAPFPPALEYVSSLHAMLPEGFFGDNNAANIDGGLIGTGPYKFDSFVPGTSMSLSKWEGYFDGSPKGDPALGAIEYRAIPDGRRPRLDMVCACRPGRAAVGRAGRRRQPGRDDAHLLPVVQSARDGRRQPASGHPRASGGRACNRPRDHRQGSRRSGLGRRHLPLLPHAVRMHGGRARLWL
jgi:ABC-type transport system substrate-binding protein